MSRNRLSEDHRIRKAQLIVLLIVLVISTTVSTPIRLEAQARINLPQMHKRLVIPDNYRTTLTDFFGSIDSDTVRISIRLSRDDFALGHRG